MSHDDKDKSPDLNLWIDPEFEARVIAWVLGEVSDFEAAELERLIKDKPELALFRKRIEAAHGLAAEAMGPEGDPLRLSPERRAELLARISEPVADTEPDRPIVYRRSPAINWRKWLPAGAVSVAASFILVFGVVRMGLRHTEFGQADFSQSLELPTPPPPPTEWDGRRLGREEPMKLKLESGSRVLLDGPIVDPLSVNQLEIALDVGIGGLSGTMDEFDRQVGQDKQAIAAAVDSSILYKGEGIGSEEVFYEYGDLDRLDANKPAVAGRSNSLFQSAGTTAPAPSSRERAKLKDVTETEVVVLSAFEVSSDDEDPGYRAPNTPWDSQRKSRNTAFVHSPSPLVAEKKDQAEVRSVVGGKILGDTKVPKSSGEYAATPFTVAEVNALEESVSTFSLHVSDVSFRLALAALDRGQMPNPEIIRPEEFYNAFDYGDPAPTTAE
ncbi:MAG: hypothetical protein DRP71_09705, partial [Verrucomicrobia bacterium]